MTKKAALVLFAVVLGALSWRVLQVETPSRSLAVKPAEGPSPSLTGNDVESETLTVIDSEPVEGGLRTVLASSRASLHVQVSMGLSGAPLAGETVSIFFHGDSELEALSSETNAQGETSFDVDPERRIAGLSVVPTALHAGGAYRYPLDLESGEERTVEIAVHGGGTLRGTVVDRSGQPVPRARVLGWCIPNDEFPHHREVVADAEGRFVVENLGPRFVLKATSESLVCHRGLRGELTEGQVAE
ncbi:MAG: carboxypeptidase-like regulatory domain-containing protein, partial [Planctomycetota bacterium]